MRHLPALLQSLDPDAGRVENWFVFNRPDSALRYHPVVGRLERGRMRSAIWSRVRRRPLDFLWPATPAPPAALTAL